MRAGWQQRAEFAATCRVVAARRDPPGSCSDVQRNAGTWQATIGVAIKGADAASSTRGLLPRPPGRETGKRRAPLEGGATAVTGEEMLAEIGQVQPLLAS